MASKATSTFMGVCSTLANKTGIDVFIVRVIVLLIILSTGGTALLGLFASEGA
jgi:phage shock protein PspC (stress-responsive transcriptional regulator)